MRKILLLAFILALSKCAMAGTSVFETANGSGTCRNVVLSTNAITNLDSGGRKLDSRFSLEIWNDDPTSAVFCAPGLFVSSTTSDANFGRRIPAQTAKVYTVPDALAIVCVSTVSVVAGPRIVITQLY
jgi:hypothetical protein